MGKKLSYFVVFEIVALCIFGLIYGNIVIGTSVHNKAKADFERRDVIIFLNGTVSEIQYDFDKDMWITIEGKIYNLGSIYRANDYIREDNVKRRLNNLYYLLDVNDTITIYISARTLINDLEIITTSYIDLENFGAGLYMTLGIITGALSIILAIITVITCVVIFETDDITHYKDKLKEEIEEVGKIRNQRNKLREELKELKSQQKSTDMKSGLMGSKVLYCHECGLKIEEKHWDNISCGNCEDFHINEYDVGFCKLGYDTWNGSCGHKKEKKIQCPYCGAEVRT